VQSKASKLAAVRENGATQVDAQRANILDAAERRFLRNGLEHTTVADIAEEAGVTRMTLYRYFRDRDTIAFEIAGRMLQRTASISVPDEAGEGDAQRLERLKQFARGLIANFEELRDAYRYLGMFDHLYADRYPTEELAAWYKRRIENLRVGGIHESVVADEFPFNKRVLTIFNAIFSFLERLAARGELLAAEQGISVEEQLGVLDEMVAVYFDRLVESLPKPGRRRNGKRSGSAG